LSEKNHSKCLDTLDTLPIVEIDMVSLPIPFFHFGQLWTVDPRTGLGWLRMLGLGMGTWKYKRCRCVECSRVILTRFLLVLLFVFMSVDVELEWVREILKKCRA